jgi:hypothetical protein
MKTCILSLLLEYIFSLFFTREFNVVCAREGGANTTSFLAAHFAKRNTKNCGGKKRSGESEGGQKFLPPNPLPFCPPERSVLVQPREARQLVGILFKMSSDFFQQTPHYANTFTGHHLPRAVNHHRLSCFNLQTLQRPAKAERRRAEFVCDVAKSD